LGRGNQAERQRGAPARPPDAAHTSQADIPANAQLDVVEKFPVGNIGPQRHRALSFEQVNDELPDSLG